MFIRLRLVGVFKDSQGTADQVGHALWFLRLQYNVLAVEPVEFLLQHDRARFVDPFD